MVALPRQIRGALSSLEAPIVASRLMKRICSSHTLDTLSELCESDFSRAKPVCFAKARPEKAFCRITGWPILRLKGSPAPSDSTGLISICCESCYAEASSLAVLP